MPQSAAEAGDRPHGKGVDNDRVYDEAEAAFLRECERYRSKAGKKFLLATDYLRVLLSMGYRRGEQV
jgi:hypothetical protein